MLHRWIGTTSLALALSVGTAAAQEPLRIGLIQSITGAFNTVGKAAVNGARLYIQQHGDTVAGEIEWAVSAFARNSNGGMIVTGSTLAVDHRDLIIMLAARHQLPAVYPQSFMVAGGGLISYGPNSIEPCRRAASYVDRILKGEMPADLPVQAPTKYELVINLKTAKALGLTIPETLLATADEVIQ
jgi:ABC-type uncharacterized transport system substrate-binding protein